MSGLYTTAGAVLAAILLYRFRVPILAALKRFDERNVARDEEQRRDRTDPVAHYKHTLQLANEQVEEVSEIVEPDERTGDSVTRFVFAGEKFATRKEAEVARNAVVVAKARVFYQELPAALAARRGNDRLN
jgi:hypothetical protein